MDTENQIKKICPSCGYPIEEDEYIEKKKLCYYCWYRAQVGTAKFILFLVMKETGNEFRTPEEITKEVNKFRVKHNKPEIKKEAVYQILQRYSEFYEHSKERKSHYLVLVKKVKTKRGRPIHKYKLSARLEKRVEKMQLRWKSGLPINSKVNKGKKFQLSIKYNHRIKGISIKIEKGDYPIYQYLLRNTY